MITWILDQWQSFRRWRRRRARAAEIHAIPPEERIARRAAQIAYLDQRADRQAEAAALYKQAESERDFAQRSRLYCLALAAEHRADALLWLAGGDATSAAAEVMEAEHYERRARLSDQEVCDAAPIG